MSAPLKRQKLTRSPAPWMKEPTIKVLQSKRNELRYTCHQSNDNADWEKYRETRNKLKKTIKETKRNFYRKALSSKKSKEVWKTIKKILAPNFKTFKVDPEEMNKHFGSIAEKISTVKPVSGELRTNMNLPNNFMLRHVTTHEVDNALKKLRNDCSTGHDQIPIKFLKPVSEYISSPLTHIINNCIDKSIFPDQWKISRVCPVPKIDNPTNPVDFRPISNLPVT